MAQSSRSSEHPLPIVLAIATPFLALMLVEPLQFDNAVYQIMARDLYNYHSIPYLNTWDQNFPGIIYLHYVVITLFGISDIALRFFDFVLQLCFLVLYYKLWSRWLRPHTAGLACVLYVLYYVSGATGLYFQRDVLSTMAVIASYYFCTGEYERPSTKHLAFVLGGLFSGASLLLRPHTVVYIGLFSLYLIWKVRGTSRSGVWQTFVFLFLSALPCGLVFLYYAQIPGGLSALYYAIVRFNMDLYSKFVPTFYRITKEVVRTGFITAFAVYAFIRTKRTPAKNLPVTTTPQRNDLLLFYATLMASIALLILQRKFLRYHFAPIFMLLMPVAALGIEILLQRISKPLRRHYVMLTSVYLCTLIAFSPKSQLGFLYALVAHTPPLSTAYESENLSSTYGAKTELPVLAYFSTPQNKKGNVEVCSYDPMLRLHLNRHSPGPYPALHAIAFRLTGNASLPPQYTNYQRVWQQEYVHTLDVTRPAFIVLARSSNIWYLTDPYLTTLRYCRGFDSLLQTNYKLDTTIGYYQIFRHQ